MSDLFRYTSFPDEPAEFDSAADELEAAQKTIAALEAQLAQAKVVFDLNADAMSRGYKELQAQLTAAQNERDAAAQEMFETIVRWMCNMCAGADGWLPQALQEQGYPEIYYHRHSNNKGEIYCNARGLRHAFPERSAEMDALAAQGTEAQP